MKNDVESRNQRTVSRRSTIAVKRKKKKKVSSEAELGNLKSRNYVAPLDKQLLFQHITTQFAEWMTWQKRLLLCNLTEKTTSGLLTTLSTVLEPIFHRDFEIKSKHGFHSSLIKTFLEAGGQSLPPLHKTSVTINTISASSEEVNYGNSLRGPNYINFSDEHPQIRRNAELPQRPSAPSSANSNNSAFSSKHANIMSVGTIGTLDRKYSRFTKDIQKRSSRTPHLLQSDLIDEDAANMLFHRGTSHSHVTNRNSSSLSTMQFLQHTQKEKIKRLGGLVKPSNKDSSTCVRQYKHQKWWLPPIHNKQSLRQLSKGSLLRSFKQTANNFITQYISWSNAEKGDFMLHIVDYCSPEEINFFANCIFQKLEKISNINSITDDILLHIFSYLVPDDLIQTEQVCQRWKYLSSSEYIWKEKCYDLASKHSQDDIMRDLELSSVDLDWRQLYNELKESISSLEPYESPVILVNEAPEIPFISADKVENTESLYEESSIDAKSAVMLRDEMNGDDGLQCVDSKADVFRSHVSFASLPNDGMLSMLEESLSKDCIEDEYTNEEDANTVAGSTSQVTPQEEDKEEKDVAFDVRVRLVQAPNRIKSEVLKISRCPDDQTDYQLMQVNNIKSVNRVRKLEGHNDAVLCLQFDSKRVMTGSSDRTVRLWDIRSGRHFHSLVGHQGGVRCLKFDDKYIITGSWDTTVMIWDVIKFTLICVLTEHLSCVSCIEIESDILITASHDATVCVFTKHSWQLLSKLEGHTAPVSSMSLTSPTELLTGSHDRTLILWDLNDYSILRKFEGLSYSCLCVKVCGSLVAAGASDGSVTFWNYLDSAIEGCIVAHDGPVNALCFVESRFFSAGGDEVVKEWDLATCTCLRSLRGHTGAVLCLRASSKRVVSGSADGTSRIWDMTCKLQQVGRHYDELNKSIIPTQVLNEQQFKKITLAK